MIKVINELNTWYVQFIDVAQKIVIYVFLCVNGRTRSIVLLSQQLKLLFWITDKEILAVLQLLSIINFWQKSN